MTKNGDDFAFGPARQVFEMVGGKWKLSILFVLIFSGTQRFGQLRSKIDGITQSMLTTQLRALEKDGLVRREVFAEVPPRVEYSATDRALALRKVFDAIHDWWEEGETEAGP